jgi:hypothetical protein
VLKWLRHRSGASRDFKHTALTKSGNASGGGELRAVRRGWKSGDFGRPTRANNHFGVDFTSSIDHQGMAAICEQQRLESTKATVADRDRERRKSAGKRALPLMAVSAQSGLTALGARQCFTG